MIFEILCEGICFSSEFAHYVETVITESEPEQEVSTAIRDYLYESERDAFYDALSELYPSSKLICLTSYSEAYELFLSEIKQQITSNESTYQISVNEVDDAGNIIKTHIISGADILMDILDDETCYGEFDARISSFVEGCFEVFVKNSKWHYGYVEPDGNTIELDNPSNYKGSPNVNLPILWYGLDQSKPIDKWAVKYGEPIPDGWFLYDTWSLAEYLLDDTNDCFLIWFTAECGCCLPEMEEILKECPIHFSEGDSIAEIKHKMNDFFHCWATSDALTADESV